MVPLSLSSHAMAETPLRSGRRWSRREVLTAIALVLLLLNVVFYLFVLGRLLFPGR